MEVWWNLPNSNGSSQIWKTHSFKSRHSDNCPLHGIFVNVAGHSRSADFLKSTMNPFFDAWRWYSSNVFTQFVNDRYLKLYLDRVPSDFTKHYLQLYHRFFHSISSSNVSTSIFMAVLIKVSFCATTFNWYSVFGFNFGKQTLKIHFIAIITSSLRHFT